MNCILEMIYAILISEKLNPPYTMFIIIYQTILYPLCENEIQEMHGRFILEMNQRDDIPEYIFMTFSINLHCLQWWESEWTHESHIDKLCELTHDVLEVRKYF